MRCLAYEIFLDTELYFWRINTNNSYNNNSWHIWHACKDSWKDFRDSWKDFEDLVVQAENTLRKNMKERGVLSYIEAGTEFDNYIYIYSMHRVQLFFWGGFNDNPEYHININGVKDLLKSGGFNPSNWNKCITSIYCGQIFTYGSEAIFNLYTAHEETANNSLFYNQIHNLLIKNKTRISINIEALIEMNNLAFYNETDKLSLLMNYDFQNIWEYSESTCGKIDIPVNTTKLFFVQSNGNCTYFDKICESKKLKFKMLFTFNDSGKNQDRVYEIISKLFCYRVRSEDTVLDFKLYESVEQFDKQFREIITEIKSLELSESICWYRYEQNEYISKGRSLTPIRHNAKVIRTSKENDLYQILLKTGNRNAQYSILDEKYKDTYFN